MLNFRGVTSIKAWCQMAHPFERHDCLQPYPYIGQLFLGKWFISPLLSLFGNLSSLHHWWYILGEAIPVPPQCNLLGISFSSVSIFMTCPTSFVSSRLRQDPCDECSFQLSVFVGCPRVDQLVLLPRMCLFNPFLCL